MLSSSKCGYIYGFPAGNIYFISYCSITGSVTAVSKINYFPAFHANLAEIYIDELGYIASSFALFICSVFSLLTPGFEKKNNQKHFLP